MTAPPAPTSLKVRQQDGKTVILNWSLPNDYVKDVKGFNIYITPPAATRVVKVNDGNARTFAIVQGFDAGTNYSFWVSI